MASSVDHDNGSFDDLYTKGKVLGRGAWGIVHEAIHKRTRKIYAVKELNTLGMKPTQQRRLKSEIDILKACSHKNIIKYMNHFLENDSIFIVMQLCPKGDLKTLIEDQANAEPRLPFGLDLLLKYLLDMTQGLDYLHDNKIIHRDVKPANILLAEDNSLIITDFNVSKVQGRKEE